MSENDPYDVTRHLVERLAHKMTQGDFEKMDAQTIITMTDKDLATWQSDYAPDSPQFIFANNEWQRRLMTQQVKATRFAAWVGIFGVVIGTLLGTALTLWRSSSPDHSIGSQATPGPAPTERSSPVEGNTPNP